MFIFFHSKYTIQFWFIIWWFNPKAQPKLSSRLVSICMFLVALGDDDDDVDDDSESVHNIDDDDMVTRCVCMCVCVVSTNQLNNQTTRYNGNL